MYFGVRSLSPLLLALVGTCASGCVVSKAKYDEAVLRADDQAQQAAELKRQLADLQQRADVTSTELEQLRSAWQQSQGKLEQTQVDVDTKDQNLAELSYEHEQKLQEHKETSAMVEQLRDELARIATHMAELSQQRDTLNQEKEQLAEQLERDSSKLKTLEAQAKSARQRALVVRDLSLALQEPLKKESVRLDLREDRILVWTRSSTIFTRDSSKLSSDGKSFLTNMGKALSGTDALVAVEERGPVEKSGVRTGRLRVVGEQFTKAGLDLGRVTLELPKGDETKSTDDSKGKSPQIIFTIRNSPSEEHALAEVGESASTL